MDAWRGHATVRVLHDRSINLEGKKKKKKKNCQWPAYRFGLPRVNSAELPIVSHGKSVGDNLYIM